MKRAALALALACGCGTNGGGGRPFDGGDYQVGTISFHVASGGAVSSSGLKLVLTDQPNTCQAIAGIPVQRETVLSLEVMPAADGTTRATVVTKTAPAAGEATGTLSQSTGGVAGQHYDAVSGSVAWTVNSGGSITITALDLGFAGVTDRITTASALTVPVCP